MARQPNFNLARTCSAARAVGECVLSMKCVASALPGARCVCVRYRLFTMQNSVPNTEHFWIPLTMILMSSRRGVEDEAENLSSCLSWSVGKNLIDPFVWFSQGGKSGAVQKCSACRGRGVRIMIRQLAPGMVQQMQSVCSDCNGEGTCASSLAVGLEWMRGQKWERRAVFVSRHVCILLKKGYEEF